MKVIDLTHTINEDILVYPGTPKPELKKDFTVKNDGFAETYLGMYSHTGTHMDSPSHMVEAGSTLDSFNASKFVGKALMVDVSSIRGEIDKSIFDSFDKKLESVDFVILKTGWEAYWGSDGYFENFPVLSVDAANYLVSKELKGIGYDCISADRVDTKTFAIHHIIFDKDMIIIENLKNLDKITVDVFDLMVLPLKYEKADGAPIRAIATY